MSREVRRVPVGWQHPVEYNPHWVFQQAIRIGGYQSPPSRLHGPTERFVGLDDTPLSVAIAEWELGQQQWAAGEHDHQRFLLEYHSADGYTSHSGETAVHPYPVYGPDGETVVREFHPATGVEIAEDYPYEQYAGQRPSAADHFPDWDVPADELGWCLYETVSEGTPVTPVFATADELIDHLCTVGQDWDQVPMRRAAAEALVRAGSSMGSFVRIGGEFLDASKDADRIDQRLGSAK